MWHRLALAWSCTKAEAKARCSIREFRDWQIYSVVEPFGDDRLDWNFALLAAHLLNIQLGRGSRPITPDELRLRFGGERRRQTRNEMLAAFRTFAARHNQTIGVN